jgi:hypothetical protein
MLEALMWCVYLKALAGSCWATEFVAERSEGRVAEEVRFRDDSSTRAAVLQKIDSMVILALPADEVL